MSEQALDLRRSLRIVWRHKLIVGIAAALGLAAGIAFTVLRPPVLTSQALVALPNSKDFGTKVFVASSNPVLTSAGRRLDPPLSFRDLSGRVQATGPDFDHRLDQRRGQHRGQGRGNRERGGRQLYRIPPVGEKPRCADRWRRCCSPQRARPGRPSSVVSSSMAGSVRCWAC